MGINSFTIILGNKELECTIKNNTSAYIDNQSILSTYVLNLGGTMLQSNVATFTSKDAYVEFLNKLLEF